jgi:hypothetical protein
MRRDRKDKNKMTALSFVHFCQDFKLISLVFLSGLRLASAKEAMKENIIIGVITAAMTVFVYFGAYGFIEILDEYVYDQPLYLIPVSFLVFAAIYPFVHRGDDDK